MNTTATGAAVGSDAWIRFMKLAQEARTRNSGLSTVQKKSTVEPAFPLTTTYKPTKTYKPSGSLSTGFSQSAPNVKQRILGGQFDTYA
jgi:hypothetical protein